MRYFRADDSGSNVVAYDTELGEGLVPVYSHPNSAVNWGRINLAHVGEEITEAEARTLHPALFERLQNDTDAEPPAG